VAAIGLLYVQLRRTQKLKHPLDSLEARQGSRVNGLAPRRGAFCGA
jgi:hypothetical protein